MLPYRVSNRTCEIDVTEVAKNFTPEAHAVFLVLMLGEESESGVRFGLVAKGSKDNGFVLLGDFELKSTEGLSASWSNENLAIYRSLMDTEYGKLFPIAHFLAHNIKEVLATGVPENGTTFVKVKYTNGKTLTATGNGGHAFGIYKFVND